MSSARATWEGAADARRFLDLTAGEAAVVELRALGVPAHSGRDATESGYFNNLNALIAAAAQLDNKRAHGVYVTLNSVNPALLARASNHLERGPKHATSDGDIQRRRFLLVDIDPKRPTGISSSESEKAAAWGVVQEIKAQLTTRGFPEPIEGDSGNGYHLIYRIDLAPDDGGLVQRVLQALAFRFNANEATVDTTVHNPARITKLYGTMARKGDDTPDRPHRRSRIISAPTDLVPVAEELLKALAATTPSDPPRAAPQVTHGYTEPDLDAAIARANLAVHRKGPWKDGTRWVFKVCPFNSEHTDNAAYLIRLQSGAVASGCHHDSCQGNGWPELREILGLKSTATVAARVVASPPVRSQKRKIVPDYVPFPVEFFPERVRRFVTTCSRSIGCDPAFVALPLLSAIAAAIGNSRCIRLKPGWSEASILWTLVIGFSGTQKSPAFEVALRAVHEKEMRAYAEFKRQEEHYKSQLVLYERDLAGWKRSKSHDAPPEPPKKPVAERFVCADSTVEAIAVLLLDQPRGLLLARDELSGWLSGFNQYKQGKGGDVAHWLEMFSAGKLIVDRKTGEPKSIHVDRAAVSIAGGIQPQVLARCLGAEHFEDGMAARFLFAFPPRQVKQWTDAGIKDEVFEDIKFVFDGLYGLQPKRVNEDEIRPQEIDLSPEGKAAWVTYYNEHAKAQAELTGDLCAAWSKLEAYAARFALVHHLLRWASGDTTVTDQVDEHSVAAGVLLARWFGQEAKRVYAILSESEDGQAEREAVDLIRARGGEISVRDWHRIRSHATAEDAEADLQAMVAAGLGSWEHLTPGPKGGRPSKLFKLAPQERRAETSDGEPAGEVLSVSVVSAGSDAGPADQASQQLDGHHCDDHGDVGQDGPSSHQASIPPRHDTSDTDTTLGPRDAYGVSDPPHQGNETAADGDWEEL